MNRTSHDVWLAPSLLAADWSQAGQQVAELEKAGVEWLHFDAMDGHFVPNLSFGPLFMQALRPHCNLHFDAHLMVDNPGERIPDFLAAGAQSISVHVEGNPHLHRLISSIQDGGALAGVVLNPATPIETLDVILSQVDFVLVMSVNPGFGGQKFLPLALTKIQKLAQKREELGLSFKIEVDGGVAPGTAADVVRAGADILVSGSGLFARERPIAENVSALRHAIEAAF